MSKEKIKCIVVECLAECLVLDQANLNTEDLLDQELGLDSLDLLDFEFRLNNKFEGQLHLEEKAVVKWETVNDVILAVASQIQ